MHDYSYVTYAIGTVGGILIVGGTLTRNGRASSSHHMRVALRMAGASALGFGILGFIDLSYYQHLSEVTHSLLHRFKHLLAGSAVGILLLEFISGEFAQSIQRSREIREQARQTRRSDSP